MGKKNRRVFDKEFKTEAVRLATVGDRTAVEEEMWRLKLKNKQLEQELEFLKKVSRYFAKNPK